MGQEARTLTAENAVELAAWCQGRFVLEHDALEDDKTSPGVNVPIGRYINGVPAGVKRASVGDTIVCKNDGTFDVIKTH